MARARTFVVPYVLSIVVVIAVLVMWIIYAVSSGSRLEELALRVGASGPTWPWVILGVGCGLLGLLIVFITYQLARSLAEVPVCPQTGGVRLLHHPRDEVPSGRHPAPRPDPGNTT